MQHSSTMLLSHIVVTTKQSPAAVGLKASKQRASPIQSESESSMSEGLYAKQDLAKKAKFQVKEEQDGPVDFCDNFENATIYDNYCANEIPPPHVEENTTPHEQQTVPESVRSGKTGRHGWAAVLLGLLFGLLLLITLALLSLLLFQGKRSWASELSEKNAEMLAERGKVLTGLAEINHLNVNLTKMMEELPKQINLSPLTEMRCCPDKWTLFGENCYVSPNVRHNWTNSRRFCHDRRADLVIISNKDEQEFVVSFRSVVWIGLARQPGENVWRWVNGSVPTKTYWKQNLLKKGKCVVNEPGNPKFKNWNDVNCSSARHFICEKTLK